MIILSFSTNEEKEHRKSIVISDMNIFISSVLITKKQIVML